MYRFLKFQVNPQSYDLLVSCFRFCEKKKAQRFRLELSSISESFNLFSSAVAFVTLSGSFVTRNWIDFELFGF